jgi:hypothetical protein
VAERYHRPPLYAGEPRSDRSGVWRFRLVFGLILAAIAVGVILLIRALVGGTGEGSPGVGNAAPASVSLRSAP